MVVEEMRMNNNLEREKGNERVKKEQIERNPKTMKIEESKRSFATR